jgi:hypothetical protein
MNMLFYFLNTTLVLPNLYFKKISFVFYFCMYNIINSIFLILKNTINYLKLIIYIIYIL